MNNKEWQDRLGVNPAYKNVKKYIVSAENECSNVYDAIGGKFSSYLTKKFEKDGELTVDDITSGYSEFYGKVYELCEDSLTDYFKKINLTGTSDARKAIPKELKKKATLIKTGQEFDDYLGKTLNRVVTVSDDVVNDIRDQFLGKTTLNTADVVRTLIGKESYKLREFGDTLPTHVIQEQLKFIWGKFKYNLERIVRTESMGAFTRSELLEWKKQGFEEVERHAMNDNRTCEICRQLAKPGNRYNIDDLLALDNPQILDPEHPDQFISHPKCRCYFIPLHDVTSIDLAYYKLTGKDPDFVSAGKVKYKGGEVSNIPVDYKESVDNILLDVKPQRNIKFENDITNDEEWLRDTISDFKRKGYSDEDAKDMTRTVIDQEHGRLLQYEDKKKDIKLSLQTGTINKISHYIARINGLLQYFKLNKRDMAFVNDRYIEKKDELGYNLEEHGIQVFGGLNFITPLAQSTPVWYFAESYGFYFSNPYFLKTVDEDMYEFLKGIIGKEYLFKGGIK